MDEATKQSSLSLTRSAILGHAVGDALGVSVEFKPRRHLRKNPVTGMAGFGTHNQPPGTWSDDTSLSLCLAESLCNGLDFADQGGWFVRWLNECVWTPHGRVFDIGNTTRHAIHRLSTGEEPRLAGPNDPHSNGNGSLMRVLPLALYLREEDPARRAGLAMQASCLTHGHARSQLACALYVDLAARLAAGAGFDDALSAARGLTRGLIESRFPAELSEFTAVLDTALGDVEQERIDSSGYVMHTLAAGLWCVLTTDSYEQAVLKAVNLGEDTDTTGAVTGGIAGLLYGEAAIPKHWVYKLARLTEIEALCGRFAAACSDRWGG